MNPILMALMLVAAFGLFFYQIRPKVGILFKLAGLIERGDPNNATPPPKHWAGFDRSDHVPESAPGFGKMGVPVIVMLAALPSASPAQ